MIFPDALQSHDSVSSANHTLEIIPLTESRRCELTDFLLWTISIIKSWPPTSSSAERTFLLSQTFLKTARGDSIAPDFFSTPLIICINYLSADMRKKKECLFGRAHARRCSLAVAETRVKAIARQEGVGVWREERRVLSRDGDGFPASTALYPRCEVLIAL